LLVQGVYSGPTDSSNQIKRLERSKEAKERYFLEGKVNSDLDLSAGGIARLLFSHKAPTQVTIWLLGPLLFQGTAYGSLVAQLEGFQSLKYKHEQKPIDPIPCDPTPYGDDDPGAGHETGCSVEEEGQALHKRWDQEADPNRQRFKLVIPKGFGAKFLPCKLFGSDYSEGTRPRSPDKAVTTPPAMKDALGDARKRVKAAVLPKDSVKALWKIEDVADELTECEVYARGG
jgi:hypothetical protein